MRLINADVLKECIMEDGRVTIDEHILECDNVHKILVYLLEKVEAEVMRCIDLQPTAYNIETVVERLKKKINPLHNVNWNAAIDEAIEIVKEEGGLND